MCGCRDTIYSTLAWLPREGETLHNATIRRAEGGLDVGQMGTAASDQIGIETVVSQDIAQPWESSRPCYAHATVGWGVKRPNAPHRRCTGGMWAVHVDWANRAWGGSQVGGRAPAISRIRHARHTRASFPRLSRRWRDPSSPP